MNKYIKIRSDIDAASAKKIKAILKYYKLNQKKMCDEIAAVIVSAMDESGAVVVTPSFIAEIKKDVTDTLNDLAQSENEAVKTILDDAYSAAVQQTAKAIGIKTDWHILRDEFVNAAIKAPIKGQTFSQRIWKNTNDLANTVYNEIISAVQSGESPKRIAKRIKDKYGVTAYQAKRLVNTEVAKVVNRAQMDVYKNSGVVDKVLYTATLEINTCENCAALDGKYFDLDKAPNIPLHPNCRCCLVPVVGDWKPSKRADNQTKENIEYVTYNEWL